MNLRIKMTNEEILSLDLTTAKEVYTSKNTHVIGEYYHEEADLFMEKTRDLISINLDITVTVDDRVSIVKADCIRSKYYFQYFNENVNTSIEDESLFSEYEISAIEYLSRLHFLVETESSRNT